jgi:branched-chain amino acid transport system permease protein
LGYVAFFAIGAYTVGLLTTPNVVTCGGVDPSTLSVEMVTVACTGIMTFWEAWIAAIVMSGIGGILLGTPVLRLRGDYLAIVTLGFGEIIRIILRFDDFSPVFGAAQGIANIPRPVIDLTAFNPSWRFVLDTEASMYYLILASIVLVVFIAARLGNSRIGRAWRAIRADEDVAQAMGIHLTRAKLLAFAIGAAFAGLGGAISATRLFGAYPDSFTLLVSINVLSLVIIGGMGSIPGVVLGAFVLIGLPEVLRELSDYRLLAFGLLLVYTMLAHPQGLYPAVIPRMRAREQTP